MSLSPTANHKEDDAQKYAHGWMALGKLLREGGSFSGRERNKCFLNIGSGRYVDVSSLSGLDSPEDGRGLVQVDWDHDGDIDLWTTSRTGPRLRYLQNDLPAPQTFLALWLQGTKSNRDAIGARVELTVQGDKQRYVKTVRAGDGFLSQSSKWLNFSFADPVVMERLLVRWPSGKTQTFVDLRPGHFQIVEDKIDLVAWTPSSAIPSQAGPSVPTLETSEIRISLAAPVVTPTLSYVSADKAPTQIQTENRPLLISLWADWCKACQRELTAWNAAFEPQMQSPLDLLIVATDDNDASLAAARKLIGASQPTFLRLGYATDALLNKLTLLDHRVLSRHRPLPLPVSFLFDSYGRLTHIYKGQTSWTQISEDAVGITGPLDFFPEPELPFAGRWGRVPAMMAPGVMADLLEDAGFDTDASTYLERTIALLDRPNVKSGLEEPAAQRLRAELYSGAAKRWARLGDIKRAISLYQEALALNPQDQVSRSALVHALQSSGAIDDAEKVFSEIPSSGHSSPDMLLFFALHHIKEQHYAQAIGYLQTVCNLWPEHTFARLHLASALHKVGQVTASIAAYEELLKLDPHSTTALNNLAWVYATDNKKSVRQPRRALELAERLCPEQQCTEPLYLNTLAASLAVNGQSKLAINAGDAAIKAAIAQGNIRLAAKMRRRLERYRSGQSLTE
ncbi:MAG: ASPIC/UnbV domain-containing protein [Myxococcota bacterium]